MLRGLDPNSLVVSLIAKANEAADISCFLADAGRFLLPKPWHVERVFISINALHPSVRGRTQLWQAGDACATVTEWPHGLENRPGYYDSPDWHVHQTKSVFRVQNLADQSDSKCDLYRNLSDQGYRDYLMAPLIFSNGSTNTLSIATRNEPGFSDEIMAAFKDKIAPTMGIILERFVANEALSAALTAYVGAGAAHEILSGRIIAGHGEIVEGAVLFADLHGFTAHSANLGPSQTVQLLNDYFSALVQPIELNGGQVLKFIGDAVLAFFPTTSSRMTVSDPKKAIDEIGLSMAGLNSKRKMLDKPILTHALCIHYGNVLYGNIGSNERLDFTIIGDIVNVASRGVELASALGEECLFTGAYVEHFGDEDLMPLGYQSLRSIENQVMMYRRAA
jgi:adenylate cyclase|tara:strand:- start:292 stop:1467 length:1176 start_codon:yes stop_codon:yes gene_type:complete